MHDYEYAVTQHRIGCRLARRVMFPDSVPPERLRRFGVGPDKLFPYPGLKEEYYLLRLRARPGGAGAARGRHRAGRRRRPPAARRLALPPQVEPALPQGPAAGSGTTRTCRRSCCRAPRPSASFVESLQLPSVIVPPGAVEAQSLVALADLVVSAGGTMNREAAALGTPVYTTYGGRLGGVDEALIRSGRLRPLTDPRAIELEKRSAGRRRPGATRSARRDDPRYRRSRPLPRRATPSRALATARGRPRPSLEELHRARRRGRAAARRPRSARARRPHLRRDPARPLAAAGADRGRDRAHLRAAGPLPRRPRRPRRASSSACTSSAP